MSKNGNFEVKNRNETEAEPKLDGWMLFINPIRSLIVEALSHHKNAP